MTNPSPDRRALPDWAAGGARIALGILAAIFWLAWQAIRIPVLTLLVMFEPIVNFTLSALALLVALTAIFWKLADPKPFPFWTVLAASLACVLALALYHALIRVLAGTVFFRSERGASPIISHKESFGSVPWVHGNGHPIRDPRAR